MGIPNPCGPHEGYQRIVAIYTKYLKSGINYYKKNNLRSATLCGYASAVNMLFKLRKYRPLIHFNDKDNMAGVIINNIIKEENIAKQRALLDSTIFAKIQQSACKSDNLDSDHSLFADIVTLAWYLGPWVSKYTQTTHIKGKLPHLPFWLPGHKSIHCRGLCLLWQILVPFKHSQWLFFQGSQHRPDHLAHPKESPKWPNNHIVIWQCPSRPMSC